VSDVHVLDVATWVWSQPAALGEAPSPRDKFTAVVWDRKVRRGWNVQGCWEALCGTGRVLAGALPVPVSGTGFRPKSPDFLRPKAGFTAGQSSFYCRPRPAAQLLPISPGGGKRQVFTFAGFGPEADPPFSFSDAGENSDGEEEEERGAGTSFTWFDDVHVLDLASMTWTRVTTTGDRPSPRAAHGECPLWI
jgi:hypothetical protein